MYQVQHEGVAELMRRDLVDALRIANLLAGLDDKFSVLVTILASWAEEMDKELDFAVEAGHLRRVHTNMTAAGTTRVSRVRFVQR